jgi:glycosyltransferase involved in cell wall biosynthesis
MVFPIKFEGWGMPITEAFAAGVPVACSNVTSIPDLIGNAALLLLKRLLRQFTAYG